MLRGCRKRTGVSSILSTEIRIGATHIGAGTKKEWKGEILEKEQQAKRKLMQRNFVRKRKGAVWELGASIDL